MTDAPEPRKGMPSPQIDEAEFRKRFLSQFIDPAFEPLKAELDRVADVQTRYGGRFVQSVDGLDGSVLGGSDWLYFVNGVYADRGAAGYRLRDGDVLWWDYRRWVESEPRTVVVGAFPEPFLHGFAGRVRPAHVRYARGLEAAARELGGAVAASRVAPLRTRRQSPSGITAHSRR